MRHWSYDQVSWGVTLCDVAGCTRPAELLSDEMPLCVPCADRELEWLCAVNLEPSMAYLLPPWTEPVAFTAAFREGLAA